jgi:photosystem II stability/assembly factor-like uncharacterized protein
MKIFISTSLFLFFLVHNYDLRAQWTSVYTDETSADATNIFVVNGIIFLKTQSSATGKKLFRSADEGTAWQDVSANFPDNITGEPAAVNSVVSIGNEIFASPNTVNKLYVSDNGGITFTVRYTFNLVNAFITSLSTDNNTLYVVPTIGSIYKSTDNGNTFQEIVINYPSPTGPIANQDFFAIGQNYVLKSNIGTLGSSDGGITWTKIDPSSSILIQKIYKAKNTIWGSPAISGTSSDGLLKYNPSTKTWAPSLNNVFVSAGSISSNNNVLFCTTIGFLDNQRRHYVSSDNGSSWTELNRDGILPNNVVVLAKRINEVSDKNYFVVYFSNQAGKVKTIIYRLPLTTTSIKDQLANNGVTFKPNFPNPFHNQTMISWSLQSSAQVTIRIYDMNGKEIETLVNGKYNAGNYTMPLHNDGRYTSGIYFCRMQAGSHILTSKLIVQ